MLVVLLDEMGSRPTGCRPSGNFPFGPGGGQFVVESLSITEENVNNFKDWKELIETTPKYGSIGNLLKMIDCGITDIHPIFTQATDF